MKFSKTTGCFYPDGIAYADLPNDLIKVPEADFQAATAKPLGATLDVIDGKLVIVLPPEPTPAEVLAKAKAAQAESIRAACATFITSGFESDALGAKHLYPSDANSQSTLNMNVTGSLIAKSAKWSVAQMCCDGAGVWDRRPHNKTQIQQVGTDGQAALEACLTAKDELIAQIDAATTVEAVQAIVWPTA